MTGQLILEILIYGLALWLIARNPANPRLRYIGRGIIAFGLKPYSRRTDYARNGLDSIEKAALDWFRTYVPERTLYNWQNASAKLVAQDLREQVTAGE